MIDGVRQQDGATVVEISGRLDASTAPDVKSQLHELIEGGQCRLVLSLSELEFLDSSGLGVLVGSLRRCAAMGGDMCLARVPEFAQSVLELTRLTRVFHVADSEEEAAGIVQKGGGQ